LGRSPWGLRPAPFRLPPQAAPVLTSPHSGRRQSASRHDARGAPASLMRSKGGCCPSSGGGGGEAYGGPRSTVTRTTAVTVLWS